MAKRFTYLAAALAGILASASHAFAQGCAMCYADAAAAGPQTQAALRHGILILMIPPMILFAGVFFLLYRRRNVPRESFDEQPVPAGSSRGSVSDIILDLN